MRAILIFAIAWFLLNILQASSLELAPDEAYYWVWSRYLDWGYFDHPPAVALFIAIGYALFKWELGVRLLTAIASSLTIPITFSLLGDRKYIGIFILLALSLPLVHAGGFVAVPDTFLIMFQAIFLLSLKYYFEGREKLAFILCVLSVVGMFYTKYHALLVVLLTILAFPKFLKTRFFYAVLLVSFALYVPHIVWQVQNDLPSVRYHLLERHGGSFHLENVINYVLGQIGIYGAFLVLLGMLPMMRLSSKDALDRIMKFNLFGTWLFFLIISFRGHVEANWTAIGLIPFMVLFSKAMHARMKMLLPFMIMNILLLFVARVHLYKPFLPIKQDPTSQFHGWKEFSVQVEKLAQGKPILANTYQIASELWFYLGKPVYSLNEGTRENQFSIWKFHVKFEGKEVLFITPFEGRNCSKLETPIGVRYACKRKI